MKQFYGLLHLVKSYLISLIAWLACFKEQRTGVRNISVSFISVSVLGELLAFRRSDDYMRPWNIFLDQNFSSALARHNPWLGVSKFGKRQNYFNAHTGDSLLAQDELGFICFVQTK